MSTYATGLPPKAFQGGDIGGPVDVAFVDRTAYVLVTLVSGLVFGEPFDNGNPDAKNGIYRIERDGTSTLIADIGQWSVDHPPQPAFFVDTGGAVRNAALLRRVPGDRRAPQPGAVGEPARFDPRGSPRSRNVVPTGLETIAGFVFVTQMGPIPHVPENGKVLALVPGREPLELASGASMLIDVERGPQGRLYGISQGQWDGVGEGLSSSAKHRAVGRRRTSRRADTGRERSPTGTRPGSPRLVGVRREHRIRRVG